MAGRIQLKDSYVTIKDGEVWLLNAHISHYSHGNIQNHDPMRSRKLLLHRKEIEKLEKENPYGVPIVLGNWAGSGFVVNFGTTISFANRYFPDIIDANHVFKTTNWLFGCHPYHNYSFVATVGATRPKAVFYGNNRADFSAIPGNVAPGVLFRRPDHFENYDDWPFLWGQNEGTIAGNTSYLIFGSAFKNLVK